MRIMLESSLEFDVLHKIEDTIFNKDYFPYLFLFLFKDDCYSIACKSCLNKKDVDLIFKACSAVTTKRLIDSVRYQNYSDIFYSEFVRK